MANGTQDAMFEVAVEVKEESNEFSCEFKDARNNKTKGKCNYLGSPTNEHSEVTNDRIAAQSDH
jgi:hypothetical protein